MAHSIAFGPIRLLGAMLASLLPTAGCQPLPHPFADDVPRRGAPILALRDSTSVAIAPIEGLPRATAEKLGPAMASALQDREIAASDKTASIGSYELVGRIQEMAPSQGKAALVVLWELRDPSGRRIGERAERRDAPAGDWDAGNEDAVARLAAAGAAQVAALLQDDAPGEAEIGGRTRLLIGAIAGAPGDGNQALVTSITEILKKQDLAIVSDPQAKADLVLDADVAAEGQHREDIFGLTPSLAKQRRPEADREPRGIDPDRLGGNEVPELVDEDDQSKDEDRCEYR